jgi:8-oxo-dGTP pyrophosphatase MutT (NUDIX family)
MDDRLSGTELLAPETRQRAVRPRNAASLLLWRDGPRGTEVLMGMRGAKHRFMPNRLVFPGGAVDPADKRAPFATPLSPQTRMLLERSARPPLAHALAVAAARELEEETGLTLGRPPRLDGLAYLCRAVTPPGGPIRFNARFFTLAAEHAHGTLAGSGELENLRYYPLPEAFALDLAMITRSVLGHLRDWLAMPEPERLVRHQVPVCKLKTWRME